MKYLKWLKGWWYKRACPGRLYPFRGKRQDCVRWDGHSGEHSNGKGRTWS